MTPDKDLAYYRSRADHERSAAETTPQADVAAIHTELARLYDELIDRLSGADQRVSRAA